MTEEWRDIPGYEGEYQVSDQGRVRSLARLVRGKSKHGTWFLRSVPPRILRPGLYKSGHVSVSLGRYNSKMVHALVLLAFVGPCPEGQESLHRNHQPSDNRLINLKYGTRAENVLMDYEVGTRQRSLTLEQVREIRTRAARGVTYGDVFQWSKEFGCNPGTMHNIVNDLTYRTVR